LRARVIAAAQAPTPVQSAAPRRRWRFDARYGSLAASLAVGIMLGAGGFGLLAPQSADNDVSQAIVAGFVRGRLSGQPVDVATSDRHTVKPWLAGKIAGATTVVDLKTDGFPLVGGRIDVIGQTPVPTLVYQRREHQIALSEMQGSGDRAASEPRLSTQGGYNLVEWQDGGRLYAGVSDLPPAELDAFAAAFRRAAAAEREDAPKP
jgi:anti-sigma factor RsiW